jgi:hypothetical protein
MWERSLSLFEEMEVNGVLRDEDCYSGAIWACVGGTKWQKSVELLKLMKFEGSYQSLILCFSNKFCKTNDVCLFFFVFSEFFVLMFFTCLLSRDCIVIVHIAVFLR